MNTKELIRQLTISPNLEVVIAIPDSDESSGYRVAKVVGIAIDQLDSQTPVTMILWEKR